MKRGVALACLAAIAFAAAPAAAQSDLLRRLIVTEGADYPGNDYQIIRDVDRDACEMACLADSQCRALTFNTAAGWCFLKSDFGALELAEGSVAGRIIAAAVPEPDAERQREAELTEFLAADFIDDARRLAGALAATFPPGTRSYSELLSAAGAAVSAGNQRLAAELYATALAVADEDAKVWIEFARATLAREPQSEAERAEVRERATAAAINAYLRSTDDARRADSLILVGLSMEARELWRPAIKAYRASLALRDNPALQGDLDALVAQHGFRIIDTRVDADAAAPRICLVFSDPLPVSQPGLADFVTVSGGEGLAVEPEESQICIDGVRHGERYEIRVRAGLPAADGEMLATTADLSLFVRDRAPWAGFATTAYVLPAVAEPTIPIQSINADILEAEIYRIGDRGLVYALQQGIFLSQLEQYRAEEIALSSGELIWSGEIDVASRRNEMVTTAIPVSDALGAEEPGVYVITARVRDLEREYWEPEATQWFVISDLGLTALSGNDGIHVFVRSITSAEPAQGVTVRLIARNNEVIAVSQADESGYVQFEAGLARGSGGLAPQVVVAETAEGGDYGFLDLTRDPFDLTDRGVGGRTPAGTLDAYLVTERGVYRPGETVHATALVRDSLAEAVTGLPITVVVERPDGVEHSREVVADGGLGGYGYQLALRPDAMRGSWRLRLYADPEGASIAEQSFLVEDFEPERLAFELTTDATAFDPNGSTPINLAARYLYGATAPGLPVEGDIAVRAVDSLAAYPGYLFGRGDDPFERIVEPIDAFAETDEAGNATLDVVLPALPATTRLLEGEAVLRLTDTNGRAVERRLTLPVTPDGPRIGIRPLFQDLAVPEGAEASFDILAVGPDGERTALGEVSWDLLRLETSYQWYNTNGTWYWQAATTTQRVADGVVDLAAGDPARVAAPVEWGRYRLEVASSGADATSTSVEFDAGWYVADAGTDTPDVLAVALDQPSYAVGDTAELRLDPRFAGVALITVVDDRLIGMTSVEVPEEGATVSLPVTEEWGPGAYITATLYRPIDLEAGRMPARALGLTWATVEPGDRDLAVTIDLPEEVPPRGPLTIPVEIGDLEPGTEAYVAVAAVDLGILNLTNYQPPAPDDWYFGQRRLGMEIRDLYGQLIDTTQGEAGAIRSGGDAGPVRLGAPPPTESLVAFHSGIVRVDETGAATVSFEMPDFNGTVRVMVEAWSAEGVGHAVEDVFVRDPVVVNTSTPRFLNTGDTSRLLIEINNVSGPAGDYRLLVDADDGIGIDADDRDRTITLAEEGRLTLAIPISAEAIGDHQFRVVLLAPDGGPLAKDFVLGVRAPGVAVSERTFLEIAGDGGMLTLDASMVEAYVPGTGELTLAAGGAARLDLPGVLASLSRYPYGCVEQLSSRAMPLLYLNDVAASIGLGADESLAERIRNAIDDVLAKQAATGAFGLWGPYDDGDLWLDAYVTEFLTRAVEAGYEVPALALELALDNLANALAIAPDFENGGEDLAYALYVLARNGRASIGDLRYYAEVKIDDFGSALAKAQLGAALALYGDRTRAERAFAAAAVDLEASFDPPSGWRIDYGTTLRDQAAVLALATELDIASVDVSRLQQRIADERSLRDWTSTQEDAWTLMAAAALIDEAVDAGLVVDGMPAEGPVFAHYYDDELAGAPVTIVNTGPEPVDAVVTVTGVPRVPPLAGGNGFTIERTYYLPDGTLADVSAVAQNDRFVVALTVTATEGRNGQLLVVDPLPAGFEIENPNLSLSGDVGRYPWLSAEAYVEHTEARTDRFVAALDRYASNPLQFTVAYTVRAVSPGVFVHPGATVEDMYRPERRANTAAGMVEIVGPTR